MSRKKQVEEDGMKVGLRREDAHQRSEWIVSVNRIFTMWRYIRLPSTCCGYYRTLLSPYQRSYKLDISLPLLTNHSLQSGSLLFVDVVVRFVIFCQLILYSFHHYVATLLHMLFESADVDCNVQSVITNNTTVSHRIVKTELFSININAISCRLFDRNNLHTVLCMSPVGDAFRTRCRMFPSLVNCCTIDWFVEWPREALLGVSRSFFDNVSFGDDQLKVIQVASGC